MHLNEDQNRAIDQAIEKPLSIISGGAGVGKTTLVKELRERLGNALQCAPTGKAAARLRQATGYDASTVHRLLGWMGDDFMSRRLQAPIIMDEASMADSLLLAAVVRAKPTKLILVGDHMQLQPVGAGAPFHDLHALRQDLSTDLKICYRSNAAVCFAGNAIRAGKWPGNDIEEGGEHWQYRQAQTPEAAREIVLGLVRQGYLDFSQDVVLCCKNGELNGTGDYQPATVADMNASIREIVQPGASRDGYEPGDRIICLKNYADKDVWNGTTGTVTAVDDEGCAWVRTDVPTIGVDGETLDEVLFGKPMVKTSQHAYALTIHKSQGSQYRRVVVVMTARDSYMACRQLLYTAVTRAQQECILVGQFGTIQKALAAVASRKTVMQELASNPFA